MENFMSILPRRFHPIGGGSPQFTRRHYIWLTNAMQKLLHEAVKDGATDHEVDAIKHGIEIFAEMLAYDNSRFNKDQFLHNVLDPDQSLEFK